MGNRYNCYMNRTGARAVSEVLIRNEYDKVYNIQYYLFVEGTSDERFFENILDCKKCKVKNLEGKTKCLESIRVLNKNRKKGCLAILDADFELITHKSSTEENVILTDFHDLEMLILNSKPNMRRIYSELTKNIIILDYETQKHSSFIDSILNAAYEIGLYKLVCNTPKFNKISLDDIPYSDIIDDSFSVNLDELVRRTKGKYFTDYELTTEIENQRENHFDMYQVCCGHDVTSIMAISLTASESGGLGYGKNKDWKKCKIIIEELLRAIYDLNEFKKTGMYKEIIAWENKNGVQIIDRTILND